MDDEAKASLDKIARELKAREPVKVRRNEIEQERELYDERPYPSDVQTPYQAKVEAEQRAQAQARGNNGGPPDLNRIGELSARGIDKISVEVADQIREIGEAAVTHAEAIRSEANALADSILEQGRRFSDRVAAFTQTAESMMSSMHEQRSRLHKTIP